MYPDYGYIFYLTHNLTPRNLWPERQREKLRGNKRKEKESLNYFNKSAVIQLLRREVTLAWQSWNAVRVDGASKRDFVRRCKTISYPYLQYWYTILFSSTNASPNPLYSPPGPSLKHEKPLGSEGGMQRPDPSPWPSHWVCMQLEYVLQLRRSSRFRQWEDIIQHDFSLC